MSLDELLKGMIKISEYLEVNSREEKLFIPEYLAARNIIEVLMKNEEIASESLERLSNELVKLDASDHYGGSGWMDFKMHLTAYLRIHGLELFQ